MNENNISSSIKHLSKDTNALSFLLFLLSIDLIFILLHLMLKLTSVFNNQLYSLEMDAGFPEFYQYIKELWIIVILVSIAVKTKTLGYVSWALIFTYLLMDDALQIHEQLGLHIATKLDLVSSLGLQARDFGELVVSAIAGTLLLTITAWFYVHGSYSFKQASRHLIMLLLAIAFFGVFIDMVHSAIEIGGGTRTIVGAAGVLEDGGEMIVMSLIAWYVFFLDIHKEQLDLSLRRLFASVMIKR